jgi:hypothetical protein
MEENPDAAGVAALALALRRSVLPLAILVGRNRCVLPLLLWVVSSYAVGAYSLLTHEQIVDITWKDSIEPLLRARFSKATSAELHQAHACAYGGCLIQDLGYYPFGNPFFSGLTHYVRTGDFIHHLLRESTTVEEYGFALGALAHYCGDMAGHPLINRAVAMEFPKLRAQYGDEVTFEDDPVAHIRVEVGFDVLQVAKGRYTTENYHDFIGFRVEKPLLEHAFLRTYDLRLSDVIGHEDMAIGTFRHASSNLLPELTRVALVSRREQLLQEIPNFSERKFLYNLTRADYEQAWGTEYRRPGGLVRIVAFVFRLVPKIGPLKALKPEVPTAEAEVLYFKSVNHTVALYERALRRVGDDQNSLPNANLDTGRPSAVGCYLRSDATYNRLLEELSRQPLIGVNPGLRANILAYYAPNFSGGVPSEPKLSCRGLGALRELQVIQTASERVHAP